VATLTRVAGPRNLELVEDAVQSAFATGLERWKRDRLPEDPAGWLYRVAYNHLLGQLRSRDVRRRVLAESQEAGTPEEDLPSEPRFPAEVEDDLLRMLFVCCHEAVPPESRLVFALKVLCGLSTGAIALRLFTTETNVHKRLGRARERLRELSRDLDTPAVDELRARLPAVHAVLYLLFNEGYLTSQDAEAVTRDLCEEAVRLATLLATHPVGAVPETSALIALMHLHLSRFGSRLDDTGGLLLLEEQDRARWDQGRILVGLQWLERSASGEVFSRYHAEAGIAAEHCLAPSFRETRWKEIAELYALLERLEPSPLHTLNRAVAVAEWQGPRAGLEVLNGIVVPSWLAGSYLWDVVLSDLHARAGHQDLALNYRGRALDGAPSEPVRRLLLRRLAGRPASEPSPLD